MYNIIMTKIVLTQLGIAIVVNLPQITAGVGFPLTSVLLGNLDEWLSEKVSDDLKSLFGKQLSQDFRFFTFY